MNRMQAGRGLYAHVQVRIEPGRLRHAQPRVKRRHQGIGRQRHIARSSTAADPRRQIDVVGQTAAAGLPTAGGGCGGGSGESPHIADGQPVGAGEFDSLDLRAASGGDRQLQLPRRAVRHDVEHASRLWPRSICGAGGYGGREDRQKEQRCQRRKGAGHRRYSVWQEGKRERMPCSRSAMTAARITIRRAPWRMKPCSTSSTTAMKVSARRC